jgi:hypothetical protein
MSSNVELPPNNSAVSTISQIIKAVMSLVADEAEVGALFINCHKAVPARHVLKFLGHPNAHRQHDSIGSGKSKCHEKN